MALLETAAAPRRRRIGLTPMIDVVFLLLVFFMLASRFGVEGAVPISAAGSGGGGYEGAPRLVEARPDGFRLNGVALDPAALAAAMANANQKDIILLRDLPVIARADQYVGWRHSMKGTLLATSTATDDETLCGTRGLPGRGAGKARRCDVMHPFGIACALIGGTQSCFNVHLVCASIATV